MLTQFDRNFLPWIMLRPKTKQMNGVSHSAELKCSAIKDNFDDIVPEEIRTTIETAEPKNDAITAMVQEANKQSENYNTEVSANEGNGFLGGELGDMINQFEIQSQFADEALALKIPQFYLRTPPSMFGGEYTLLTKEALSDGFSLSGQDAQVSFELATGDISRKAIQSYD